LGLISDDLMSLLLGIALGAAILSIISGALLRSNVVPHSPAFVELFSWVHVRGGWVQSLKLKFLLPWVTAPYISIIARRYLLLARAFALVAVGAIALIILQFVVLPWT
jgi:hypothetical protein